MTDKKLSVDQPHDLPLNLDVHIDDDYRVIDSSGGVWYPNEEALEKIKTSDNPRIAAIRMCHQEPMRGTWVQ